MSGADLAAAKLVQFPAVVGGVVPVANLPGLGGRHLVLDGPTLAAIFDGRIKRWNDAAIARLNPALELPDRAIVVVYRSDSSGTTSVFTEYLAAVSPPFAQTVGDGKTVDWPTGIGGKGNAGVAANVLKIRYTIGYVEFSFVKLTRLEPVAMVNRAGEVVMPRSEAFAAAARDADWRAVPGMGIGLTNQAAADAWPISAASFVLVPVRPNDPLRVADALRFFDWALQNGQDAALELGYVPLPPATAILVREAWREVLGKDGAPVLAGES